MQEVLQARIMNKRGTEAYWNTRNPRLLNGEFAIVDFGDRDRIKIGNGTDLFTDLPYFDESAGAFQGTAVPTTVPNPASINMWYFAGPGTYTNFLDYLGNPIIVDATLAILSKVSGVWTKLDVIPAGGYTENRRIIKQGGTPTVDCDDDNIETLYYFIVLNTAANRYVFEVLPGDYVITDGLVMKDYMSLEGFNDGSGNRPIVRSDEAAASGDEPGTFTIKANANAFVRNIDLVGFKNEHVIKFDNSSAPNCDVTFENCRIQHFGGFNAGATYRDVYTLMYSNQKLTFRNCEFPSNQFGVNINNLPFTAGRNNSAGWTVTIEGCKMSLLSIGDFLQYSHDRIVLTNNDIWVYNHTAYDTIYTANPGVSTANRGFYPNPIMIVNGGNRIGMNYSATKQITGVYGILRGHNVLMQNSTGSTIPQGIAVTKAASVANANAYTYGDVGLPTEHMARYSGGEIRQIVGYTQEDTLTTENGAVRLLKNAYGSIQVSFDSANGAASASDALEITSNGQVAKYSAGTIVGYAEAASGAGYVQMLPI